MKKVRVKKGISPAFRFSFGPSGVKLRYRLSPAELKEVRDAIKRGARITKPYFNQGDQPWHVRDQ